MTRAHGSYDVAQVCRNGHLINARTRSSPEDSAKFCAKCSAPTVTSCDACSAPIRGAYEAASYEMLAPTVYWPPAFCESCGAAFPWIGARLEAAEDLAGVAEGLDEAERAQLKKDLATLVRESPTTSIAAVRFARLADRMAPGVAAAFRDILYSVASEGARKVIWPGA